MKIRHVKLTGYCSCCCYFGLFNCDIYRNMQCKANQTKHILILNSKQHTTARIPKICRPPPFLFSFYFCLLLLLLHRIVHIIKISLLYKCIKYTTCKLNCVFSNKKKRIDESKAIEWIANRPTLWIVSCILNDNQHSMWTINLNSYTRIEFQ